MSAWVTRATQWDSGCVADLVVWASHQPWKLYTSSVLFSAEKKLLRIRFCCWCCRCWCCCIGLPVERLEFVAERFPFQKKVREDRSVCLRAEVHEPQALLILHPWCKALVSAMPAKKIGYVCVCVCVCVCERERERERERASEREREREGALQGEKRFCRSPAVRQFEEGFVLPGRSNVDTCALCFLSFSGSLSLSLSEYTCWRVR